jgi:hypothetical protein
MAKQVKIIWIYKGLTGVGQPTVQAEEEIAELLNQGWKIVTAGGGGGSTEKSASGFIVLVLDEG